MNEQFSRAGLLIGEEGLQKLQHCRIAIFGIGGVGGYALEALIRSGVGEIDIIDSDTVDVTNLNRQIIATHKTLNSKKVDVAEKRILEINPNVKVNKYNIFFCSETAESFDFESYDYVIDAIDTVTSKLLLIECCNQSKTPIISCMGTGNKLNPSLLEVSDIYKTSVCPLARVMRYELKKRNINKLKVVYSKEQPIKNKNESKVVGSLVFVPATAGMIIAAEVIKDILEEKLC